MNRHYANIPGLTRFQRENGGQGVTGRSGIVPFVRMHDGRVLAPVAAKEPVLGFMRQRNKNDTGQK